MLRAYRCIVTQEQVWAIDLIAENEAQALEQAKGFADWSRADARGLLIARAKQLPSFDAMRSHASDPAAVVPEHSEPSALDHEAYMRLTGEWEAEGEEVARERAAGLPFGEVDA